MYARKRLFLPLSVLLSQTSALPTAAPSSLDWKPCNISFGIFGWLSPPPLPYQCANLSVPLDYTDPDSDPLNLNLLRVEALNKPAKKSILFNPGGPGSSGVQFVATGSDLLHEVLGGDYDLIGFDPRGTGQTIPFFCNWTASPLEDEKLAFPDAEAPKDKLISYDLEEVLDAVLPVNEEFATACEEQMGKTGKFLSTAFVARDMLEIVKAMDGEDALLNYVGVSYGTYLGQTFASMFPERVGSMLLDSNINPRDWRSGHQYTSMQDADEAFIGMLEECIKKPNKCAMAKYAPKGDPLEIVSYLNSQAPTIEAMEFGLIGRGWAVFKKLVFSVLYDPPSWSWSIATVEESLRPDNTTDDVPAPEPPSGTPGPEWHLGVDADSGIACSESLWRAPKKEDYLPVLEKQSKVTMFADSVHEMHSWVCAAWKMEAKEIYDGDFEAKTKNPILFVNGKFDPITPFASAMNASAGFEGSVVLTHGGHGHGIYAQPSLCTAKAVQAYFGEGVLPAKDTVCEPDVDAFDLELPDFGVGDPTSKNVKRKSMEGDMTEEDVRLLKAMRSLSGKLHHARGTGKTPWL